MGKVMKRGGLGQYIRTHNPRKREANNKFSVA